MFPKSFTYIINLALATLIITSCGGEQVAYRSPMPKVVATTTLTPLPVLTPQPTFTLQSTSTFTLPCPPFKLDTDLPTPDIPQNYIGRHYDALNLPKELKYIGGTIIKGENVDYALTEIERSSVSINWLRKLICTDSAGKPYFEIVDVLVLPPLAKDRDFAGSCANGSQDIPWIIAVGKYDKAKPPIYLNELSRGRKFERIDYAWRVDLQTKHFVQVLLEGLTCVKYVQQGE